MSKFKSIMFRVILGKSGQKEDGVDYLCTGFECCMIESHSLVYPGRDDDDEDGNSITSFSTTATADNLPGTGRTVDTYIFQPIGRRIERLAMRFTIASLHPARIAQYMEMDDRSHIIYFTDRWSQNDVTADFCPYTGRRNRSTILAGMKGLVKQTQSTSINRSASALAALIRVSLTEQRNEIYVNLSRIEPIFHLETLAGSLACSHPEKRWFLFLVKLARETLVAVKKPSYHVEFDPALGKEVWRIWLSPKTALNLRQRLVRALRVYRSFGLDSLQNTIGEACAICAEAVSKYIGLFARGDAHTHILETVYFTVIFVLRSIHELADYAKTTASKQIYMILRTLSSWIDAIVYRCLNASYDDRRYDIDKLKVKMLFRSLVNVHGDTTCVILPQSSCPKFELLDMDILPRRHREAAEFADDTPIAQGLTYESENRTRRLFRSFNELEREACGVSLESNVPISHSKIDADPRWILIDDFGEEWWEHWKKALDRARRVQIPENLLAKQFREARRIGLQWDPLFDPLDGRGEMIHDERDWGHYQLRRGSRHKWGQFLRSNMDWDWDLGTCMKRLFKVEQTREGPSPVAQIPTAGSLAIDQGDSAGETWKISAGRTQGPGALPKEVQIAYETENGETQYMTFVPAFSTSASHPSPETAYTRPFDEDEVHPKADSRHGKGFSGGDQEIESLKDGPPSSDASQPEACGESLVDKSMDDCKGTERIYDAVR